MALSSPLKRSVSAPGVLLTSGYAAPALSQDHGLPETLEVLRKPYRREELAQKIRLVISNQS
jgi:hypothetical protein